MLQKLFLIGLAGALGSLSRYAVAGWVHDAAPQSVFPWGTVVVNVLGCFLAGAFWSMAEHRLSVSPETRAVILVGFMGGFTTFSAYMLETGNLLGERQWVWAAANMALQNVGGLATFLLGLAAGRLV